MPSLPFSPDDRLLIVSPHLDDAAFSCGTLLALHPGAQVLTVFAGIPPASRELTDWDRLCGFHDGREAMQLRREEDRCAMQLFSAQAIWLDFLDSQYREEHSESALREALVDRVKNLQPHHVFLPAGLFHGDHVAVHRAMLQVCRRDPELSWWLYEDALYRRIPGLLQHRLVTLAQDGWSITPLDVDDPHAREVKRLGVQCYASQWKALKQRSIHHPDIFGNERYWHLEEA